MNETSNESTRPEARPEARPYAVVTGASSGIGYELAKQFAQNGFDVLAVAENDAIASAAVTLSALAPEASVEAYQVDLAGYEGVETLCAQLAALGRPVDVMALNAGVGASGDFARETDLMEELNVINLNVTSTVHLAKRTLKNMLARGQGKLMFTSSIVSDMPGPYQACYAASKAFIQSFARAIRYELKDTSIQVTTLLPGATDTPFFERAGMQDTLVGTVGRKENDPADVAQQGFEGLMAGKDEIVAAALTTKITGFANKFLPESVKAGLHAKVSEHGTARH